MVIEKIRRLSVKHIAGQKELWQLKAVRKKELEI